MPKKNLRKTHLIKNKGLRRVCAVVCLCFALFAVALPFTRSRGNLTVSAASTTVVVPDVSAQVQDRVKQAIETMTGLSVDKVNVRITGVSVENE